MIASRWARLAAILLLPACSSGRWVEFRDSSPWMLNGQIIGEVSPSGAVHVKAWHPMNGLDRAFEKQLAPSEMDRVRQAVARHVERYGPSAAVRPSLAKHGGIRVSVYEKGRTVMTYALSGACTNAKEPPGYYELWNEIMDAIRSADYDTREHAFHCQ